MGNEFGNGQEPADGLDVRGVNAVVLDQSISARFACCKKVISPCQQEIAVNWIDIMA
jgi:hypothetical protein